MFLSFCRDHYKSDKFPTRTPHHLKVIQSEHKLKLLHVTFLRHKSWTRENVSALDSPVCVVPSFCRSDKSYTQTT